MDFVVRFFSMVLFLMLSSLYMPSEAQTVKEDNHTITFQEFKGKCPVCLKKAQKSTITGSGMSFSTLMGFATYYDEQGKFHSHDPNTTTSPYSCSKGHEFVVTGSHSCPQGDYPEIEPEKKSESFDKDFQYKEWETFPPACKDSFGTSEMGYLNADITIDENGLLSSTPRPVEILHVLESGKLELVDSGTWYELRRASIAHQRSNKGSKNNHSKVSRKGPEGSWRKKSLPVVSH